MSQQTFNRGLLTFAFVSVGQLISLVGSGLTGFALGVWVFQRTGLATPLALSAVFAVLPNLVLSPFAGTIVDRWDRRKAMLLSDTGAALSTLALAALLFAGRLELWQIYLATAISSAFRAFQWPAYSATIPLLVPPQHLGRANGVVQGGMAMGQIISPVLAGFLVVSLKLQGVLMIDLITYAIALLTLLAARIPQPNFSNTPEAKTRSLWEDTLYGWTYLARRPGLMGLVICFALAGFLVGLVGILTTPLVLAFASPAVLGTLQSVAGLGMLVGTLVMSIWGGPKRRIHGVLGFMGVYGLSISFAGLRPSAWLLGAAAFGFFFSQPFVNGSAQTILQSKVDLEVQGRVFALSGMISGSTLPLAYLIAGPLADRVFEPLLSVGGPFADSLGRVLGTGPGRGIGLLFIMAGLLTIVIAVAGYLYPRLRRVEDELPDVLPATPAAEAASLVSETPGSLSAV